MQPAAGADSKTQITPVLHFKSRRHIGAFSFSAAEGDDLSCHAAEQFNNGFIIIFHKTQKTSWTGPVKCFSVCAFCVWLSEGNDLIWHISEQQNNVSAWSFLIAGENKRLEAIHLLTAYFDTACSGLRGAPQKESGGLDELLLKHADREILAGRAAGEGHELDFLRVEEKQNTCCIPRSSAPEVSKKKWLVPNPNPFFPLQRGAARNGESHHVLLSVNNQINEIITDKWLDDSLV